MQHFDMKRPADSWRNLYVVAGFTTLVAMALFLFDVIAFFVWGPPPGTAEAWFTLLQNDRPRALLLLEFPMLLGGLLYVVTFLALYRALSPVNEGYAALAALCAFVGFTILLVTETAYPMMHLARQYAGTAGAAERVVYVAAAEGRIATATAGANLGGFLIEGAALLFSLLMLRGNAFSRLTAWLGIVGHGLDFARIALNLAFAPEDVTAVLLMIGGLPQFAWLILVGRALLRLGRGKVAATAAV